MKYSFYILIILRKMNNMLADYIALKAKADQKRGQVEKVGRKPAKMNHLISHHFDCKDPWNWKFP